MDDLLELGIFFWFKLVDSHLLKPIVNLLFIQDFQFIYG